MRTRLPSANSPEEPASEKRKGAEAGEGRGGGGGARRRGRGAEAGEGRGGGGGARRRGRGAEAGEGRGGGGGARRRGRGAEAGEGRGGGGGARRRGRGAARALLCACSHLSLVSSAPAGLPRSSALAPRVGAWLLAWGAAVLLHGAAANHSGKDTNCSEIILIQEIVKDGFHRDLMIRVKLGINIENAQTCKVLIKYHLPKGLYVDPYELASLQEHNVTEAMIIQDTVDLEAPDYLSEEFDVLVYAKSDSQCSECFRTILPIHCRYHQPEEKEERAFVVVKNPELFVSCHNDFPSLNCWKQSDVDAPCSVRNRHICQWSNVKYKSVNQNVILQVPVGLRVHCLFVCVITLLVTILCSGLILRAIFKHGHFSL